MALVTRISRLFTADAHALLDRLEAPDVLLRQALREMQEALEADQRRSQSMAMSIEEIGCQLELMDAELIVCDEELDLCLAQDQATNEHLSRSVVRRKLSIAGERKRLVAREQALTNQYNALRVQIAEHGQSLQALQQKAALLIRESGPANPILPEHDISEEQIDIALLAEKTSRSS